MTTTAFSLDGGTVVAADADGILLLLDPVNGTVIRATCAAGVIGGLAAASDGSMIAVARGPALDRIALDTPTAASASGPRAVP